MLSDKDRASLDQGQAIIVEVIPPLLRSFYKKLVDEGFSDAEALELTKSYLVSVAGK